MVQFPLVYKEEGQDKLGDFKDFLNHAAEFNPRFRTASDRLVALAHKLRLTAEQCADFFPDAKKDCDRVLEFDLIRTEFSANTVEDLRAAGNYLQRVRQIVSDLPGTDEDEIATPLAHSDQSPATTVPDATSRTSESRASVVPRSNEDPEVAKRRAIVRNRSNLSARKLCREFDFSSVPLIDDWSDELGQFKVKSWGEAYKHPILRTRIDTLISKDKSRLTGKG